jgi:AcrR family transcriptional regulator
MPSRATGRTPSAETATTARGIVDAAITIADAEGLDSVSIRRVATKPRMRPMSLYTYIPSKEALLDLMGEEIVGKVLIRHPLPPDWRQAITLIATRYTTPSPHTRGSCRSRSVAPP